MGQVADTLDRYRVDFEQIEGDSPERRPRWIDQVRTAAFGRFAELGFPTTRLEDWRYTDVAQIAKMRWGRAGQGWETPPIDLLKSFTLEEVTRAQLVFVNGRYAPDLSFHGTPPNGVMVSSLATVLARNPAAIEAHLAQHVRYHDQAFAALNTAFIADGAFVFVPKGTVVETPIHLLFISCASFHSAGGGDGSFPVSYPRNLIVVDPDSQVRIVESYAGLEGDVYFTNVVTEIVGGENAVIEYYKAQQESEAAFHVATVQARLGRSGTFTSQAIDLGGALVRNNLSVALEGEGAECTLNGLYMLKDRQHVDNHTRIDHVQPHGNSRQLYKGILDGKSRGVFNGKIVVHKAAQQTDAKQVNKNLLLSEDAVIDSKPQLEIFNNDVKCTHGTTIGQYGQEAMFYLRSRGIDRAAAESLLTYAFASELLGRITVEPIRVRLEALLLARLRDGAAPRETP